MVLLRYSFVLIAAVAVVFGRLWILKIGNIYKFLPPQQAEYHIFGCSQGETSFPQYLLHVKSVEIIVSILVFFDRQNARPPSGRVLKLDVDDNDCQIPNPNQNVAIFS